MISQSHVHGQITAGPAVGHACRVCGVQIEVRGSESHADSHRRTGNAMRSGAWLDGIPIVAHPYAIDVCNQEDMDHVANVQASIMQLAPHVRQRHLESRSQVIKWFNVCEGSWRALETLYTYGRAAVPGRPTNARLEEEAEALKFFRADLNAKAARERARIVTKLVSRFILNAASGRPVRLVSIASGSARAVLAGIRDAGRRTSLKLIDNNRLSLQYSAEHLVAELGVKADITCVLGNVQEIGQHLPDREGIDVAEAVGILDYFDDASAIRLLAQVKERLATGGMLIASNIMDNPAREFLHSAVGWRPMHYRTVGHFVELFVKAGFRHHQLMAHVTPTEAVYVTIEARPSPS